MRRSLILVSSLACMALVGQIHAEPGPKSNPVTVTKAAPGKPRIGAFGLDVDGMERNVKPGNDFAAFAGGTWVRNTEIPADRATWTTVSMLQDLSNQRVRTILDQAAAVPDSKIGIFYSTFMDEATIDAQGVAPIKPWFAQIEGAKNKTELAIEMAKLARYGIDGIFATGIAQDERDPLTYVVAIVQGGLCLPDRDLYLKRGPRFDEIRDKYKAYIATMLGFADLPDAKSRAAAIFDFEQAIAQAHWTRSETRDARKRYNKLTFNDIAAKAPGFPWGEYAATAGIAGRPYYIVAEPSAIVGEAKLFADTPLSVLQAYMKLRVLHAYAKYLSKPVVDVNFAFTGTVLNGAIQQQPRWKRALAATNDALADDVGKVYVARYFAPESKAVIDQLVRNVIAAMRDRLDKLEWMAPETKRQAQAKLAAVTLKIGYPARWRDYTMVTIKRGDLVGNVAAANAFEYARDLAKLDRPLDRTEWGITPMTVNAYGNPLMNDVVFPAAILQAPFFDANADPAINYGGIGMVFAKQISQHFDDVGRWYDKDGNQTDWWTVEDAKRFTALTGKLVEQYNAYEPIAGQHIQGGLTLGENIADLAGLEVAYDAYRRSLGGKPAPVIGGMTGDQRFFLGYAQLWRSKYRESALRAQMLSDPHAPGPFRIAEVRNVDAWYAAFGVQPGDALYLAPADRVRIW